MRQSVAPLTVLSCLLLCLAFSGCGLIGGGACAQELPYAEPSKAAPGEGFRLRGGGFSDGCYDAGPPFLKLKEPPQKDIRVDMHQGEKVWNLASGLESGGHPDYVLDAKLRAPDDAEPGKAWLVVSHPHDGGPLKVSFRVMDGGRPGSRAGPDEISAGALGAFWAGWGQGEGL